SRNPGVDGARKPRRVHLLRAVLESSAQGPPARPRDHHSRAASRAGPTGKPAIQPGNHVSRDRAVLAMMGPEDTKHHTTLMDVTRNAGALDWRGAHLEADARVRRDAVPGWQSQKNTERTVQGALQRAAVELFGGEVSVGGAGRTDAGVHALAQV